MNADDSGFVDLEKEAEEASKGGAKKVKLHTSRLCDQLQPFFKFTKTTTWLKQVFTIEEEREMNARKKAESKSLVDEDGGM
jgi:hypothetical protein